MGFAWATACSTYPAKVDPVLRQLAQKRYSQAVSYFEKALSECPQKDRLLCWLEYASVLQSAGRYSESVRAFIQADQVADQVDYFSVLAQTKSLVLNQEQTNYRGETYELLMINALNALNFLALGNWEGAQVEIRKLNDKVKKFRANLRSDYKSNALSYFLAGLIYESQREWDDAYIAYTQGLEAGLPEVPLIQRAIIRVAHKSGRMDQLVKLGFWQRLPPNRRQVDPQDEPWLAQRGCLWTWVALVGLAPRRVPLDSVYSRLERVTQFVRLPRLESTDSSWQGSYGAWDEVYDVYNDAEAALAKDRGALLAKRLGALATKELIASQIDQRNEFLGFLVRLFLYFSERPDLRYWSTLMDHVQAVQIVVPLKQSREVIFKGEPLWRLECDKAKSQVIVIREIGTI